MSEILAKEIAVRSSALDKMKLRRDELAEEIDQCKVELDLLSEINSRKDVGTETSAPVKKRATKKKAAKKKTRKRRRRNPRKKVLSLTDAIKGILRSSGTGRTSKGISSVLMRSRALRYKREKKELADIQKSVTGMLCHMVNSGDVKRTRSTRKNRGYLYELVDSKKAKA